MIFFLEPAGTSCTRSETTAGGTPASGTSAHCAAGTAASRASQLAGAAVPARWAATFCATSRWISAADTATRGARRRGEGMKTVTVCPADSLTTTLRESRDSLSFSGAVAARRTRSALRPLLGMRSGQKFIYTLFY